MKHYKIGAPRKITDEQILRVIELIKNGQKMSSACREVGIKINTFTEMKSRKRRVFSEGYYV